MTEEAVDVLDYQCVFCCDLLVSPVTLACDHSFCSKCLNDYLCHLKLDAKHLQQKSTGRVELKCPTCRHKHSLNVKRLDTHVNVALIRKIKMHFAEQYALREEEVAAIISEDKAVSASSKIVAIGNCYRERRRAHQSSSRNVHSWNVFVRIEGEEHPEKFIDHVYIKLHPTFRPNKITLRDPPYEVKRVGWGTFDIPIRVVFKEKYGVEDLKVEHELVFTGAGAYQHYDVELKAEEAAPAAAASSGSAPAAAASSGSRKKGRRGRGRKRGR